MGSGEAAPMIASGKRPPSRATTRAPMRASGSVTRAIGRRRGEASPVKKTVMPWLATRPMRSRAPVPELPRSSMSSGSARPPMPTPSMLQTPSAPRVTPAPSARIAAAVRSTSSPSSRPLTRVRPMASAPRMSARCDTDLSPGTRMRPLSAPAVPEVRGVTLFPSVNGGCLYHNRAAAEMGSDILPGGTDDFAFDSDGGIMAIGRPPCEERRRPMAKPEWGTKRICPNCGARYYDLNREGGPVCPKCHTAYDPDALLKTRRARPATPVEEPIEPMADEEIDADIAAEEGEVEDEDDMAEVIENVEDEEER